MVNPDVRIVVTGGDGFIGKNLRVRLGEAGYREVVSIGRNATNQAWVSALGSADVVFHLAGANRPASNREFIEINRDLTRSIVEIVASAGTRPRIFFTSSAKVGEGSDYARSKAQGEQVLLDGAARTGAIIIIQRLPNVFGKWARPDYNSAVATFCHNVARGLPVTVHDPAAPLTLLYIDDLIDQWLEMLASPPLETSITPPPQAYDTTVGAVAGIIQGFARDREAALIASVGIGLTRALYATYVAALPEDRFSYPITAHTDPRGSFSEMLKTRTSGQFSYFTAHPGVTRGGHYHHTKTEKFLIVHGEALFRFRHILTGDTHEVRTSGATPVVVETIPGWAHDVTNVGEGEMVSLLWANEIFDRARPDTIAAKV